MSFLSTIKLINFSTLRFTPAIIAGVQTAEAAKAQDASITGPQAQHAVVSSVFSGVSAVAGQLEQDPNETVRSTAALVNVVVSVMNFLVFKKAPAQ